MEDHAGHIAATRGGGHAQRGLGERSVVMLTQGEARQTPRREVLDGGQVELALVGGDLGEVAAPLLVDSR